MGNGLCVLLTETGHYVICGGSWETRFIISQRLAVNDRIPPDEFPLESDCGHVLSSSVQEMIWGSLAGISM